MKKYTMQEWADFTGCYVAKNEDGRVFCYSSKPHLIRIVNHGCDDNIFGDRMWVSVYDTAKCGLCKYSGKKHNFLDIHDHDWRVLVEPHKDA